MDAACGVGSSVTGVGVRVDGQYLCGLREGPISTVERNIEYEWDFSELIH